MLLVAVTSAGAQQVACPSGLPAPDSAALVGTVRDAETGIALPGVLVSAAWAGGRSETLAGSQGEFSLCGLPADAPVTVAASLGGLAGSSEQLVLAAGETETLHLEVGLSGARGSDDGTGRIAARVGDALSGEPVEAAIVSVAGTHLEAIVNSAGLAVIEAIPAGRHLLRVHHLSYGRHEVPVELEAGTSVLLDIELLAETVELEPIHVTVAWVRNLALETRGFYERQEWGEKLGIGYFFTREDIERRRPRLITYMIADVPGARLDCSQGVLAQSCEIRFTRNSPGLGCQRAAVYIDGSRVIQPDDTQARAPDPGNPRVLARLDELVSPREIAGMEVYQSGASLPAEFGGSAGRCGAIVIWTN